MKENQLLKQRYKIRKKIGQGGFGITYLALDLATDKLCVVKYLSLKQVDEWKSIELFEREAKILANLDHPQIPRFIDFFTVTAPKDNKLYLVQEYIKGDNLTELIDKGKHFTEQEAIEIALEISQILEYLHAFSPPLIHRDIKPSNILCVPRSPGENKKIKAYLIDFGAVRDKLKDINRGDSTIVGTYGYIPPEQYDGRPVPASDIYSLGATLIYILSHKEPFEIEKNKLRMDFKPFVNISKQFQDVLERMTEPDWKDRYETASELRRALESPDSEGLPSGDSQITIAVNNRHSSLIITMKAFFQWLRRQIIPVVIIAVAATALIGGGMLLHRMYTEHEREEAKIKIEEMQNEEKYNLAIERINQKKYCDAIAILNELKNYKDSEEKIRKVSDLLNKENEEKYGQAVGLFNKKKYAEAKAIFLEIEGYEDSAKKILEADRLIEEENYRKKIESIDKMPLTTELFFDAIIKNDLLIVENFLSRGMNVDSREPEREYSTYKTALMVAAQYEHADMVRLLLKYNANVRAANSWNETALDFSEFQANTEIINILKARM